ncbi:MAG: uncharacterized membrane protein (UPF0127 family) [Colwellia polaris]|jgi:uncharacterized membrane protein (UPF0127 family)
MDELKASMIILAILAIGFAALGFLPTQNQSKVVFQTGSLDSAVKVEVADNSSTRAKGLMNRESLCRRCGMIFVFENAEQRAFWMKNTSIPLDIIFISEDREVINVEQADPEPDVADENLTLYRSDEPAKYVVEVNQGFAEEKSIEEGTKVLFRSIPLDQ